MSSRHETIYFHKCLAQCPCFQIQNHDRFREIHTKLFRFTSLTLCKQIQNSVFFYNIRNFIPPKKFHVTSEFKLSKKLKNKEYEISATVAFHFLSKNVAVYNCARGLSSQKAVV